VATDAVTQEAASKLGVEIRVLKITTEMSLEDIFEGIVRSGVKSVLVGSSSYFNNRTKQLGELSVRYKLPAIYQLREFVAAGGLMSYGPSLSDAYRIVGEYTGRVLKGAQPANLPVQQQSKIDLVINLKTAKELGIIFPLPMLGRADEIIE
jgi:putative ABC transport system substrate-binding protein